MSSVTLDWSYTECGARLGSGGEKETNTVLSYSARWGMGVSGSSTRTHAAHPVPSTPLTLPTPLPSPLTFFFSFSWASSFRPTSFWSCRKMASSFSRSRMRDSLALFCSASLSHSDTSRETRFSIALHGVAGGWRKGKVRHVQEASGTQRKRWVSATLYMDTSICTHFSLTCNFFQVLPSPPAHGRAAPQV